MLPVLRTEQAEADLVDVLTYLEERSPAAAERLTTALDERCVLLGQFPEMGRARLELGSGIRSITIERHVLFYRITPTAVEILRILHGSRDIEALFRPESS